MTIQPTKRCTCCRQGGSCDDWHIGRSTRPSAIRRSFVGVEDQDASSSASIHAASLAQIGNMRMLSGSVPGLVMVCGHPSPAAAVNEIRVDNATWTSVPDPTLTRGRCPRRRGARGRCRRRGIRTLDGFHRRCVSPRSIRRRSGVRRGSRPRVGPHGSLLTCHHCVSVICAPTVFPPSTRSSSAAEKIASPRTRASRTWPVRYERASGAPHLPSLGHLQGRYPRRGHCPSGRFIRTGVHQPDTLRRHRTVHRRRTGARRHRHVTKGLDQRTPHRGQDC